MPRFCFSPLKYPHSQQEARPKAQSLVKAQSAVAAAEPELQNENPRSNAEQQIRNHKNPAAQAAHSTAVDLK